MLHFKEHWHKSKCNETAGESSSNISHLRKEVCTPFSEAPSRDAKARRGKMRRVLAASHAVTNLLRPTSTSRSLPATTTSDPRQIPDNTAKMGIDIVSRPAVQVLKEKLR
jgi:hypothetical protein